MQNSNRAHVSLLSFPLSPEGRAEIVYKNNAFYVSSHIENAKSIRLPEEAMAKLIQYLPRLQNKMKQKQFVLDGRLQDDARHHSAGIQPTSTLPLDAPEEKHVINLSKPRKPTDPVYRATLVLSTFNQKVFIWLRLYFDAEDKYNPGNMLYDLSCRGGSILNDTDAVGLSQFYFDCMKKNMY